MSDIAVSTLWKDLLEAQANIDITLGGEIREVYSQWLWETGCNLCRSPLWEQMPREELIEEFSKKIKKSKRYIQYGTALYKMFPYSSWEDVRAELNAKYPDQSITEKFFIKMLDEKAEVNDTGGELSPLHRGLKSAVDTSLEELIEKIKGTEEDVFVKLYVGDYHYIYKIVDKEIKALANVMPALVEDKYEEAKRIVLRFWHFRNMEGNPDRIWMAREISHAKALLKMGLTEEDIFAICEWRISDAFWASKLTSLGLLRTRISAWAMESRNAPKSFEEFLDKHSELDYRKIEPISDEATYARAEKLKEAVTVARKNGVSITQDVYEKLYRAAKIKYKLFEVKN